MGFGLPAIITRAKIAMESAIVRRDHQMQLKKKSETHAYVSRNDGKAPPTAVNNIKADVKFMVTARFRFRVRSMYHAGRIYFPFIEI